MSQSLRSKLFAQVDVQKKEAATAVASFLQTPKKKRKRYIIGLFSPKFDERIQKSIFTHLHEKYEKYTVEEVQTLEEFRTRYTNRRIELVLIDDTAGDIEEIMMMMRDFKMRAHEETFPVLFFTRTAENLITCYNKHLYQFHELDEYIPYRKLNFDQVVSRVKSGIEQHNRRRSRRFPIKLALSFRHLRSDRTMKGHIVDLSSHGAKIAAKDEDFIFSVGDQISLDIPIGDLIPPHDGDFFRVSAVTRRVCLPGNTAAVSFEHMTERQQLNIYRYVAGMIRGEVPVKG